MSVADKLATIAENEQKVFDAGKQAGDEAFWNMLQDNGNRKAYDYAFVYWSNEYIRPLHKVVPTTYNSLLMTFFNCKNLKKVESKYFDFSEKPRSYTSNSGYHHTFNHCEKLEEIEDVGLKPQYQYYYTFSSCYKLKTIAKMEVDKNTLFVEPFFCCFALQNLNVVGTIGQNGFDLRDCGLLSKESIESVISALSDVTTGLTVTFSKVAQKASFTQSEWDELIATKPNWTISLG